MSTTAKLGLSYWLPGTSSPQSYQNDAITRLDLFASNTVLSRTTAAQPGSPMVGDAYILPASPTGTDWGSFDEGDIVQAIKDATGTSVTYWVRYTPVIGLPIVVQDSADSSGQSPEIVAWNGSEYVVLNGPSGYEQPHNIGDTLDGNQVVDRSDGEFQYGIYTGATTPATFDLTGTAGQRGFMTISIYNNSGGARTLTFDDAGTGFTLVSNALGNLSTMIVTAVFNGAAWALVQDTAQTGDRRGN